MTKRIDESITAKQQVVFHIKYWKKKRVNMESREREKNQLPKEENRLEPSVKCVMNQCQVHSFTHTCLHKHTHSSFTNLQPVTRNHHQQQQYSSIKIITIISIINIIHKSSASASASSTSCFHRTNINKIENPKKTLEKTAKKNKKKKRE